MFLTLLSDVHAKSLTSTVRVVQGAGGGGGVDVTPPLSFDLLLYSETILPSVRIYFVGRGAAGGL